MACVLLLYVDTGARPHRFRRVFIVFKEKLRLLLMFDRDVPKDLLCLVELIRKLSMLGRTYLHLPIIFIPYNVEKLPKPQQQRLISYYGLILKFYNSPLILHQVSLQSSL